MSESQSTGPDLSGASRDQLMSARFAAMVLQQTNMASMLLGQAPHPETGQAMLDLDAARMFIDQLEMLETKTQGNLSAEESRLLSQSLTSLRLAFVEAADKGVSGSTVSQPLPKQPEPKTPASDEAKPSAAPDAGDADADAESRKKKFSKSYGEG